MIASGAHNVWRIGEFGFDDLVWYVALPYLGYAAIGVAAVAIWKANTLLIGIRNPWDLVVYNIQRGSS
jgi:hypothetical protein